MQNSKVQEFYNQRIQERYKNNYEFNRWFLNPRSRADYFMTYAAISYYLKDITFSRCLEVGPGPGTWTKLLFRLNPEAHFDLLDISEEMRKQFELEMRARENVRYFVDDFTKHEFGEKYDLFFSSRAIEYFEDKKEFFDQLKRTALPGASCCLIAKNPNFSRAIFKKSLTKHKFPHGAEISNKEMKKLLTDSGFSSIEFYPVVTRIPFLDSFFGSLREKIFKKLLGRQLSGKTLFFFSESYLVKFKNL